MRIGIISDIHENFHNLIRALEKMEEEKVEQILCLGDLMNAGIAKILAHHSVPTYMIWGNNDGEKVDIMRASFRKDSKLTVSLNTYDFLELGGRKIFICHYDDLAEPMAESGRFDAVFFGHNHKQSQNKIGNCIVVNPGEVCAQKSGVASIAIYDTTDNSARIVELEDIVSLKSEMFDKYLRDNLDRLDFRSKDSFNHL